MTTTAVFAEGSDDLVLVVNPQSGVDALSRQEIINLYMGRLRLLPSGIVVLPIDLNERREEFYRGLLDKTLPEINAYWARLVFSGRASPPRQALDVQEVLDIVTNNKGAIGYLPRKYLNDHVKPLLNLSTMVAENKPSSP